MLRKKKVKAIIEKTLGNTFGVYSNDLPGITGYGHILEEAINDFKTSISEVLEGENPASFLNNGKLDITYELHLPDYHAISNGNIFFDKK